jgi:hypothetical protein
MGHKHSHAAYAIADVEDAERGEPAISLEPWAARRGLEYLGSSLPGAFTPVMPTRQAYVFNLSRGPFGSGRFGCLAHELDEVGLDDKGSPRIPGGYVHLSIRTKLGGIRGILRTSAHLDDKRPDEPFAARAFWLPVTAAAVRVPEAALLPVVVVKSAERFPVAGNPRLDEHGLPGFRMRGSQWIDDALRAALAGAARPLAGLGASHVALRLDRGVVSVTQNGFLADEARLDLLASTVVQVAEALAAVAAPLVAPESFAVPLPPPDRSTWPPGYHALERHEVDVLARVAAELAMAPEDPVAFHRSRPLCPVPGRAMGVVRGLLPGTGVEGRVGFFVQGGATNGSYRSAVMVPARPGAATPLGGTLDGTSDLYVEVADGVAHAWPRARSHGALDAAGTVAAAVPTFRRLGLADV